MRTHKQLKGEMQIGQGRETPLMSVTVTNYFGSTERVDLLFSADDRHVWVRLTDADSVRALRDALTAALGE